MERQWYRLTLFGEKLDTQIWPEQAEALRANGIELKMIMPSSANPPERLRPMSCYILETMSERTA